MVRPYLDLFLYFSSYRDKPPIVPPVIEPIVMTTPVAAPTIDAAKRRQLPAWIREGKQYSIAFKALGSSYTSIYQNGYTTLTHTLCTLDIVTTLAIPTHFKSSRDFQCSQQCV